MGEDIKSPLSEEAIKDCLAVTIMQLRSEDIKSPLSEEAIALLEKACQFYPQEIRSSSIATRIMINGEDIEPPDKAKAALDELVRKGYLGEESSIGLFKLFKKNRMIVFFVQNADILPKIKKIEGMTEQVKKHLNTGEEIVAVTGGDIAELIISDSSFVSIGDISVGGWLSKKAMNHGNGIFLATNKRIIAYYLTSSTWEQTKSNYGLAVFSYADISSIEMEKKWSDNRYQITFSGPSKIRIKGVETLYTQKFVEYVRSKMGQTE